MNKKRKPNYEFIMNVNKELLYKIIDNCIECGYTDKAIYKEIKPLFKILPAKRTLNYWIQNSVYRIRNKPYKGLMEKWRKEFMSPPKEITQEEKDLNDLYDKINKK